MFFLFFLPFVLFAALPPPNENREWQAPFISADGFRTYADFAYDDLNQSLDIDSIPEGATLYVRGEAPYIDTFFNEIHPRLPFPYVLITHATDDAAPGRFRSLVDDPKIIAWFAVNYDGIIHPKVHPLPLGIANYNWHSGNVHTIRQVEALHLPKRHLCHMSFRAWTYPSERELALKLFSNAPFCHTTDYKPFYDYLIDCASSVFSISPRGNGCDTHRVWECIHFKTIPIVKTSSLDCLYEGLPVLIIQNWEEVTEAFLEEKEPEMATKTYSMEKMTLEYWTNQIEAAKLSHFLEL